MKKIVSYILAAAVVLSMAACARNPEGIKGMTSESTAAGNQQTTSATMNTESVPGGTTGDAVTAPETVPETSAPQQTEPAPTVPPQTEPETPTDPSGSGDIYTMAELESMSTKKTGYGPGTQVDDKNRPVGSVSLQKKLGKYEAYFIAPDDGNLYLTFDEGYENGYTASILDTLKEKNVKAVFFVTKAYCKSHPELVQRMVDEGHAVGNHSVSHLSMPTLSVEKMVEEVMGLHEYVKEHFGYEMHLFRPPMGEYSEQSLAVLHNLGYKTVEWSFAYYDYDTANQMDPAKAYDKVMDAAHSGGIFLLHAVSKTNTEILGDVIDGFREKGLNLELFS